MARGSQGELAGAIVDGAEFDPIRVSRFEMSGDHLVGIERHALAARCDPVGKPLMQIRAIRLEQPAVGDVADEHVMEAPHRLVADVGSARLGEFESTKPLEGQLDSLRALIGECTHGAEREVAADHRGDLEHAPIGGVESLQARRQKRMDRRGDGDGVHVDGESPAVRFLDENSVVREHPDQLPHEQGIAAGGRREAAQEFVGQPGGAQHLGGEFCGGAGVEAAEVDRFGYPPADGDEFGPEYRGVRVGRAPAPEPALPSPTRRGAR